MRWKLPTWEREVSGWHFTFLGDMKTRVEKTEAVADKAWIYIDNPEFDTAGWLEERIKAQLGFGMTTRVEYRLRQIKRIPIDSSFPRYIVENQDKYRHLIWQPDGVSTD